MSDVQSDDLKKFGTIAKLVATSNGERQMYETEYFHRLLRQSAWDATTIVKMTYDIRARYPNVPSWDYSPWQWCAHLLGTDVLVVHAFLPGKKPNNIDDIQEQENQHIYTTEPTERSIEVQFDLEMRDDVVKIASVRSMVPQAATVISLFVHGGPYWSISKEGQEEEGKPSLVEALTQAAWDGKGFVKEFSLYLSQEYPAVDFWHEGTRWVPSLTGEDNVLKLVGTNLVGFEYTAKFLMSTRDGVQKLERVAPKIYEPMSNAPPERMELDKLLAASWIECSRDVVLPMLSRVVTSQERLTQLGEEIRKRVGQGVRYEISFAQMAEHLGPPMLMIRFRQANNGHVNPVDERMTLRYQLAEVNGKVYIGPSFPSNAEPLGKGAPGFGQRRGWQQPGWNQPGGFPGNQHEGTYEAQPMFSHSRMGMRGEMPQGDLHWGDPRAWHRYFAGHGPAPVQRFLAGGIPAQNEIKVSFTVYAEIEEYIDALIRFRPVNIEALSLVEELVSTSTINNPYPPRKYLFQLTGSWGEGVPLMANLRIVAQDANTFPPAFEFNVTLYN